MPDDEAFRQEVREHVEFGQMAFEVEDLDATLADLGAGSVTFERFEMPGFAVRDDTIRRP